ISELLAACYRNSLAEADRAGCKTVAFPNISTGVYGYPKDRACTIAITTTLETLPTLETLEEVVFVCFDRENYEYYCKALGGTIREL
ncbi:MAG: macro domain-containing protein, partial [Termitinemataceae bacterium]